MDLEAFQGHLRRLGLDGWLLYDSRRSNTAGLAVLGLPEEQKLTRRFFYWVPAEGVPQKIVHAIEAHTLDALPGKTREYARWQELETLLQNALQGVRRVAMEYSPQGRLPTLALVNAGTVELVRSFGIEVVGSGELLAYASKPLTEEQMRTHRETSEMCVRTMQRAFFWIRDHLAAGASITEWEVVDFIEGELSSLGLVYEYTPSCAAGPNAADPHYVAKEERASSIRPGDLILIDLWARKAEPSSIYADITYVGVAAGEPTERQKEVFACVRRAQQAAIALLEEKLASAEAIQGWEVDRAARDVIEEAGFGAHFTHRTGHNIGEAVHGPGTHLDDHETHDTRPLLPGCCFSIEPGIYLPGEFGIRLECNALITPDSHLEITGQPQEAILCLTE